MTMSKAHDSPRPAEFRAAPRNSENFRGITVKKVSLYVRKSSGKNAAGTFPYRPIYIRKLFNSMPIVRSAAENDIYRGIPRKSAAVLSALYHGLRDTV